MGIRDLKVSVKSLNICFKNKKEKMRKVEYLKKLKLKFFQNGRYIQIFRVKEFIKF